METIDRWGPWAAGLSDCERLARLRTLRTIVHLLLGPRGDVLERAIRCVEESAVDLDLLPAALSRLPSLDYRKVLASYAAIARPAQPCGTPA
ncbi:hypothetical protein [Methylobacterium sp. 22177]|uniref:hypothetical protein n=1 Tax=Methylobacterium sp. 22177 TaxID=3453885 RepID=UPI003F8563E4